MYLSRMELNPRRRKTRELMASPEKMHAAIMACWPEVVTTGQRILWRLDHEGENPSVYIMSPAVPSFEHLQEQVGWSQHDTAQVRDYRPLLDHLVKGSRYHFRLAANPVHVVTDEKGRKRRLGHVSPAHQLRWLLDRQDAIGAKFPLVGDEPLVRVVVNEKLAFRRKNAKVTLQRAVFDGTLEVTDPRALRSALTQGIGKAKAYGCGLLTLAHEAHP